MKPRFRKVSGSKLEWPIFGNQILVYENISIFYIFSVAGRNLIFCFIFQATQPNKCFWVAFFGWVSIFLLSYQNAQNTQYVNEKAGILVDNQRKILLYVEAYLPSCQTSMIKILENS